MFIEYSILFVFFLFFFNDTATTEIYTLSLHDALPISGCFVKLYYPEADSAQVVAKIQGKSICRSEEHTSELRHGYISYAVFCLKKKKRRKPYWAWRKHVTGYCVANPY